MSAHHVLHNGLGLRIWACAALLACAHTSADRAPDPEPAPQAASDVTTDPDDSQLLHGVFIEPSLAEACGIARARTYFDYDSAELSQGSRFALAELAQCLQDDGRLAGESITVLGHADPRGSDEYNDELGLDRARKVGLFLIEAGVPQDHVDLVSRGEQDAHPTDPLQWPFDRRVDIVRAGQTPPPVPSVDAPTP